MDINKLFTVILICVLGMVVPASVKADLFYWPKEYKALQKEKEAVELELKNLKAQYSEAAENNAVLEGRIKELEGRVEELNGGIEELNGRLELVEKEKEEESLEYEAEIEELNDKLQQAEKAGEDKEKQYQDKISELERQLAKEIKRGDIKLKTEKGKIILDINEKILFDLGSAVLKKNAKTALKKIAGALSDYSVYRDSRIQIDGHTDNVPVTSKRWRDNWQLSGERALSVLNFLLENTKLDPSKFSFEGYGEYMPEMPNDTAGNRSLNRRVEIVIIPGKNDN